MDEQADKGNQYTYDGRTDRQGQSIYLRWMKTYKGNHYTYNGRTGRQGQSIYLRRTNRQTRAINIPTMDEQADKGKQYTYDGRKDRQGKSIYLRWTNR